MSTNQVVQSTNSQSNEAAYGSSLDDNMSNIVGESATSAIIALVLDAELLDNGTGALYSHAVNSALVSGPVLGSGEAPNNSLYKSIPFTTASSAAGIEILHALVYDNGFGNVYLILYFRIASSNASCFVRHGGIEAYDATGQIISYSLSDFGVVNGSLNSGFGIHTPTRVSPGEIVYLFELFERDITLDQIVSIKIFDLEFSLNFRVSDLIMQPISYEVDGNVINVLIANQSSQSVQLFSSTLVILTDEGIPIYTELGLHGDEAQPDGVVVQPGTEMVVSYTSFFKGSSSNIRVLLDYDPIG